MLLGLGLVGTTQLWSLASQRARERQLLWVGNQFTRALKSYYQQSPGVRQYPLHLEELLDDKRFPMSRHHLRQLYTDPITRTEGWGLILNAEGRIGGVRSLSEETPLKQAEFPLKWEDFNGRKSYAEWRFLADATLMEAKPAPAIPGAGASAAAKPGTRP